MPTERLCLHAYSLYPRAKWSQQWRETKGRDISGRIPEIVRELKNATVKVARLVEEGERRVCPTKSESALLLNCGKHGD